MEGKKFGSLLIGDGMRRKGPGNVVRDVIDKKSGGSCEGGNGSITEKEWGRRRGE